MQRLEVSGAVRPLYGWLGIKGLNWRWNYSVGTEEIASPETSVHGVDQIARFPTMYIKVLCTRHGFFLVRRLIIFLPAFVWVLFRSSKWLAENAIGFVRAMNSDLRTHVYHISGSKKQRNSCSPFSEFELSVWVPLHRLTPPWGLQ